MSEEIKFEKAMDKLEKIVEDLENGDVSLDDALKKYEEGVKLSRACQKKLSQVEKKIQVLTKSLDGTLDVEELDSEDDIAHLENSKKSASSRKKKKKSSDDGGDLLI